MKSLVKAGFVGYNPATRRASYLKHKEKAKEYSTHYNRKKRTGITKEQYATKLQEQLGVCAICGETGTRALAIDHNHSTGQLRGLLCGKCNRGLGYLNDSSILLQKALNYLQKYDY